MTETGLSAARWRKSSRSHNNSQQQCVEVAGAAHAIGIRDSKDPAGPRLAVSRAAFRGLVERVKAGALDHADAP
ncbi:DUF397 domain-containing protein [Actinomadura chibensis]|uniref:DUF397 domain-containing protein n=1 Tax=Actinomadura chibensis TaxID=392828 RepID=A0A5D0NZ69_9ACTN|nr:DUF397 domain-containing protein [Actinomadura chibensis]TYB49632.1 DUF397 domain-containing protein [Actinomadura chibensis]